MKHMDQATLDAEQQREARDLHRTLTAALPIPSWGFLNIVTLRKRAG